MTDLRAQVLTTAAEAATQATQAAADSCLSAPKGATPSGSHWYYRIDRVTKRQCWYLREESDTADDKFARAAPPASAPSSAAAGTGFGAAERSRASRSPTRVPNGSPSNPAPSQIHPPEPSRERSGQSPHPSFRIARAQPCRTCSRRRRCRRCDGTTLPPQGLRRKPTNLQTAAAASPADQRAAGRGSATARGRTGCARRRGCGDGKADRIAAETASGDGRRACAGRPHGERDRQDRPHAGAPRHAPQAARDVGFRKDKAAFATADVPRRGRRAAARRRRAP